MVVAGASGCVVASRIASSSAAPSVLLLEAGGGDCPADDSSGPERFDVAFNPGSPYNWQYETVPQDQLAGQRIDYFRGKALGGSTAINFCGWTVGPRDDFDELAAVVADNRFGWENVCRCPRKIENLHPEIPDKRLQQYVHSNHPGMSQTLWTQ